MLDRFATAVIAGYDGFPATPVQRAKLREQEAAARSALLSEYARMQERAEKAESILANAPNLEESPDLIALRSRLASLESQTLTRDEAYVSLSSEERFGIPDPFASPLGTRLNDIPAAYQSSVAKRRAISASPQPETPE